MGSPGSEATRGDVRRRALEILFQRAQTAFLPLDDGAEAQQGPAGTPPPPEIQRGEVSPGNNGESIWAACFSSLSNK